MSIDFDGFILGVESSCDETAAAMVYKGRLVVASVVASQIEIHKAFGGVVPELASRHHVIQVTRVIREAIQKTENRVCCFSGPSMISAVAVSQGPGLIGSLMVGLQASKGFCLGNGIPLVGVNHLEAHMDSVYAIVPHIEYPWCLDELRDVMANEGVGPPCPHVTLLVSGGHTALFLTKTRGDYSILGATRDDASGEAFDKMAKLLGLGYPGGVVIDQIAKRGDPHFFRFPRALSERGQLDFSFSGLKTAVRIHLEKEGVPKKKETFENLCASIQEAIVDALARKAEAALELTGLRDLVVSGGVAANSALRKRLEKDSEELHFNLYLPPLFLCTDNAVMVAIAGARRFLAGERANLELDATSRWLPGSSPGEKAR